MRALLLSLLLAGCMVPTRLASDTRFLALGDSYTIGEGVDPSERWPVVLAGSLREAGLDVGDPTIVAVTGWTTDELDAGIDAAVAEGTVGGTYRLVTLLIGVNNQYRGRSADEYRGQFRALLGRAVGFAGGRPARVVVLSIPDWGVTRFAAEAARTDRRRAPEVVAGEIDRFNAVSREETASAGAHWVDVAPASRAYRAELAPDGLHPSGAQYVRWAAAALPEARAALSGR